MEWTKETLIKTYVICANITQERIARKFYKSFGFELDMPEVVDLKNHFPCVIGILNYNPDRCIKKLMTAMIRRDERWNEIKLPTKPRRKFPREMIVSDDGITWRKKLVFCKMAKPIGKYVANKYGPNSKGFETQNTILRSWKYAKEIE